MMVVVVVSDCPLGLRGDLTKWLFEINTGVYVGNLSARVRDGLWKRICGALKTGRATMVYHTNGEQKLDFMVHNTAWEPVDFDGIKLMRRPFSVNEEKAVGLESGFSKAASIQKAKKIESSKRRKQASEDYVVASIITTGPSREEDDIIEIGAILIEKGLVKKEFQIHIEKGKESLKNALSAFLEFIGNNRLVAYNMAFFLSFLQTKCTMYGLDRIKNPCQDIRSMVRRNLRGMESDDIKTVAQYFGLELNEIHGTLTECHLAHGIYEKLKEM